MQRFYARANAANTEVNVALANERSYRAFRFIKIKCESE